MTLESSILFVALFSAQPTIHTLGLPDSSHVTTKCQDAQAALGSVEKTALDTQVRDSPLVKKCTGQYSMPLPSVQSEVSYFVPHSHFLLKAHLPL